MKKVLIKYREIIFLFIGAILLIGGIVGYLLVSTSSTGNLEDTNIPTEVFSAPTPFVDLYTFTTTQQWDQVSSTPVPEANNSQVLRFPNLNDGKYFVHPSISSGLESPTIPERIEIPSVGIDDKVVIADYNTTNVDGETFGQWQAPSENAAGWQPDSALLGQIGNTVINGHHNEFGEPFGKLVDVKIGDMVYVYSHGVKYSFIIANRMILQERFVSTETRLENARWLSRSSDIRLTLVTCWPKFSNTHRLILVARPYEPDFQIPTTAN